MSDFDDLYNKKFNEFYSYARSKVSKEDIAKDITQEAFLKLNDSIQQINPDKYENWLRVVIKNKCTDYFRSKYRNREILSDDSFHKEFQNFTHSDKFDKSDECSDILERILNVDKEEIIKKEYDRAMACVEQLSPMYKLVFIMYEMENLTHKEIAIELEISEGTSKSNLARAKRNLIKLMNND